MLTILLIGCSAGREGTIAMNLIKEILNGLCKLKTLDRDLLYGLITILIYHPVDRDWETAN